MGLPCFRYARLKFVAVLYIMRPVPIIMPTMKEIYGRAEMPRLQPRSSWNEIGYCGRVSIRNVGLVKDLTHSYEDQVEHAI